MQNIAILCFPCDVHLNIAKSIHKTVHSSIYIWLWWEYSLNIISVTTTSPILQEVRSRWITRTNKWTSRWNKMCHMKFLPLWWRWQTVRHMVLSQTDYSFYIHTMQNSIIVKTKFVHLMNMSNSEVIVEILLLYSIENDFSEWNVHAMN